MTTTRINDRTANSTAVQHSIQGVYSPNILKALMKIIIKYILQEIREKITSTEAFKLLQT